MQIPTREHVCQVFDFVKFRNVYKSAEYYYWMKRPDRAELAGRFRISPERAERWIEQFKQRREEEV